MNIIFICKHNVFRSRVAEAYFKKINKNPDINVSSAGVIAGINDKCSSNQLKALKELNIDFVSKPKSTTVSLLRKKDIAIIVADDVSESLFNNKSYVKKVISWDVPDVLDNDKDKSLNTIRMIMQRVQALAKELEVKAICP